MKRKKKSTPGHTKSGPPTQTIAEMFKNQNRKLSTSKFRTNHALVPEDGDVIVIDEEEHSSDLKTNCCDSAATCSVKSPGKDLNSELNSLEVLTSQNKTTSSSSNFDCDSEDSYEESKAMISKTSDSQITSKEIEEGCKERVSKCLLSLKRRHSDHPHGALSSKLRKESPQSSSHISVNQETSHVFNDKDAAFEKCLSQLEEKPNIENNLREGTEYADLEKVHSFLRVKEDEEEIKNCEKLEMKNLEQKDEKEPEENIETVYKNPYYLQNFDSLLKSVMDDESNVMLFNYEDLEVIKVYHCLSDAGKKLYIRIFSRKLSWIPLSRLKYPEIADDLVPVLKELVEAKLIDSDENLTDLEQVLQALSAADVKTLAKSYHVEASVSQKKQQIQELLKKSQQSTLSSMFVCRGDGVAVAMLKRAKKLLQGIYKLKPAPRGVFVRVMMLFSLVNTSGDEDSGNGGQGQLFQMLMVNMGKVVYPSYIVRKVHNVFSSREDVVRLEKALQLESDLLYCTENGKWGDAFLVFKKVVQECDLLEGDESIVQWNKDLPDFLRSYTATSIMYRLLNIGIEILQRRKEFTEAVELLNKLLAQTTYCCSYRGYWWERLALNLDAHLKQPLESLRVVAEGLADKNVKVGHRLALYQRAETICQRPKLKLKSKLNDFYHEPLQETPKVTLEGRVIHQDVSTAGSRFLLDASLSSGSTDDMTVGGVEEFVLDHYKRNGFPMGIHAEGSVVTSLFALFFWDVLFMDVPDVFHSSFQALPLDLYSNSFYENRKEAIEERLRKLHESSVLELQNMLEDIWNSHEGTMCIGMNWEKMRSTDFVKGLVSCMGGQILSGLLRRYALCPRHTRSGFPDLTLWNSETGSLKICEVKGPGDRLSHKQILWIDYLLGLGVDAEVCHVKAVAAKRLKPAL